MAGRENNLDLLKGPLLGNVDVAAFLGDKDYTRRTQTVRAVARKRSAGASQPKPDLKQPRQS